MQRDTLSAVRDRIRTAWAMRRVCGLIAVAAGLRVGRIIRLEAAGRLAPDDALRMALEAEALALCFPPLPSFGGWRD
ncbi:hypothetical protein [Methylobacterium frigidaeris]|uniref:Uncharacterized protein n=1 Tax=Methylobacterium frigidaeris TaxID=2038277 RepID=A0AA37M8D5_9HYPH|nr:hypothetical protein [Methylobacterium frigidaeris]GJD65786.1 hypothetical protein MPEAHAMD_5982 [Methylobacterium frigidaeris]